MTKMPPGLMAPEQLEGQERDARSDIYALGLVLYEMAARNRFPRGQAPLMEASRRSLPM